MSDKYDDPQRIQHLEDELAELQDQMNRNELSWQTWMAKASKQLLDAEAKIERFDELVASIVLTIGEQYSIVDSVVKQVIMTDPEKRAEFEKMVAKNQNAMLDTLRTATDAPDSEDDSASSD